MLTPSVRLGPVIVDVYGIVDVSGVVEAYGRLLGLEVFASGQAVNVEHGIRIKDVILRGTGLFMTPDAVTVHDGFLDIDSDFVDAGSILSVRVLNNSHRRQEIEIVASFTNIPLLDPASCIMGLTENRCRVPSAVHLTSIYAGRGPWGVESITIGTTTTMLNAQCNRGVSIDLRPWNLHARTGESIVLNSSGVAPYFTVERSK